MSPPRSRIPAQLLEYQRRLIGVQKTAFDTTFNALASFQDQQQKMVERALRQIPRLPEEAQELMKTWQQAAEEARRRFKAAVDESYDAIDGYLDRLGQGEEKPAAPAAAAKPKPKARKAPARKKTARKKTAARPRKASPTKKGTR